MKKLFLKKGSMIVIISICVLFLTGVICANAEIETNETSATNDIVEISAKATQLKDIIGETSSYSEVYTAVSRQLLMGESLKNAEKNAKNNMVKSEALFYLAKTNGFSMTYNEIENKIKNEIEEAESAVNFKEYYSSCQKQGISFEDYIAGDKINCERVYVTDKMYMEYYDRYHSGKKKYNGNSYETWDSYWNAVEQNAISVFKQSKAYSGLLASIDSSIDNIKYADEIIAYHDKLEDMDSTVNTTSKAKVNCKEDKHIESNVLKIKELTNAFSKSEDGYGYVVIR